MLIAANIVLLLISAMWLWSAISGVRAIHAMPRPLTPDQIEDGELDDAFVSIIIAARDEAGRVEETVLRALAQQGVRLEVIAVDDRSTDGTGESLDALAAANPALHVEHITTLPEHWLGKCHALHCGSLRARGDWLLFLDADTHLEPDALAGALGVGLREGAEHVSMLPSTVRPSFWGQIALGSFMSQMSDRAMKVNRDHPRLFMGVGAFNLVRRETYDTIGGHQRLRMQVIDDMVLGLCVRKVGARTRTVLGLHSAQIEYGTDLPSVIRLFEKNGYAAVNFSDALIAVMSILIIGVFGCSLFGPVLAITLGVWAGWIAFAALAISSAPAFALTRVAGFSSFAAFLTPLGFPLVWYAFLRSVVLTRLRGGIVWRETFYSLKELKAARLSWRVKVPLPEMEPE